MELLSITIDLVKLIILAGFSLAAIKNIVYWVWLWQIKEYRIDRMAAHLELFPEINGRILLVSGYYALMQQRLPVFTKKAGIITGLTFLLYLLFLKPVFGLSIVNEIFTFIILYLLAPVFVFIFMDLVNMISTSEKEKIMDQAKKKMESMQGLLVIGITGSYGKSTTKEILSDVLEKKFKVLKTPANINTPIGISELILNKLENDHQVFVVEMGAYTRGEIKTICDIVKPKIGILTGINEQHLALFGNIHNTIDAKFELIKSLPTDGLAVLNCDNRYISEKMKKMKAVQYGNTEEKNIENLSPLTVKSIVYFSGLYQTEVYATNIIASSEGLQFDVCAYGHTMKFTSHLLGTQNVYNILAAIAVALSLGITLDETASMIGNIVPREKSMAEYKGPNNSYLVDDTYNSNPTGVMAGIEYLRIYQGRKVIVFGGIIELGNASRTLHEKLGEMIADNTDFAILTNPIFAQYILKGYLGKKALANNVIVESNQNKIHQILRNYLNDGDVVYFAGRGAEKALNKLKEK